MRTPPPSWPGGSYRQSDFSLVLFPGRNLITYRPDGVGHTPTHPGSTSSGWRIWNHLCWKQQVPGTGYLVLPIAEPLFALNFSQIGTGPKVSLVALGTMISCCCQSTFLQHHEVLAQVPGWHRMHSLGYMTSKAQRHPWGEKPSMLSWGTLESPCHSIPCCWMPTCCSWNIVVISWFDLLSFHRSFVFFEAGTLPTELFPQLSQEHC